MFVGIVYSNLLHQVATLSIVFTLSELIMVGLEFMIPNNSCHIRMQGNALFRYPKEQKKLEKKNNYL